MEIEAVGVVYRRNTRCVNNNTDSILIIVYTIIKIQYYF